MKKEEQKEIIRKLRKKYGENYRQNYSPTLIYLPKRVREEVDKYCKEKEIVKTTWISRMVIKEMEKILQKKYDEIRKKFVEIEGKGDGKTKKKLD
jgi:flagellar motor switch protein FliG